MAVLTRHCSLLARPKHLLSNYGRSTTYLTISSATLRTSAIQAQDKKPTASDLLTRGARYRYNPEVHRPGILNTHFSHARNHTADESRPLSRKALDVQRRLEDSEIQPLELFRDAQATGDTDIDIVVVCLEGHFKRLKAIEAHEQSAYVKLQPLASVVIDSLLQDNDAWLKFVSLRHKAAF